MMMKKKFAFLFVAMGLFMFASCSSEDSLTHKRLLR
ncbi:hypothetical protein IX332_001159 [Porphyromonas levii]|nr:hypothetical protein [Porphyromonas levii]MBR8714580.1 hypothetical protein [Porphyromonas levii]MBR8727139.1 hypothetical protein [Porphyromonas levii]MBR8729835.1 hypothetical protein [Porphyromonas levii]MBR8731645.1 hypothetical protein [Porphyromonas levii]